MPKNEDNSPSFSICNGYVHIWVPKLNRSVVVGKIKRGLYVWAGACESKHTTNMEDKRCWGIDEGLVLEYLLPKKMSIEIRTEAKDVYTISAYDVRQHGIVGQVAGYGRQFYVALEHFKINGKPFNES